MPKKKILICDESGIESGNLYLALVNKGFDSSELVGFPEKIIDNIKVMVRGERPDYIITEALFGKCYEVLDLAKGVKPDIIPIIFSSDWKIVDEAKEKGYAAFGKPYQEGLLEFLEED